MTIGLFRDYELLKEEMAELTDRHVATEAELNIAREEKKTFDSALQTLKDDMLRVRMHLEELHINSC